jgi:GntR family transcriptional regulator
MAAMSAIPSLPSTMSCLSGPADAPRGASGASGPTPSAAAASKSSDPATQEGGVSSTKREAATANGVPMSPVSANADVPATPVTPFSPPTFSPLYRQIKGLITQSLESGEWRPGDVIPSEIELAARYGVSQGTVRKAIDELAADNLVVRRQGKGTFVATHNEDRVQFRFLRLLPDDGTIRPHVSDVHQCRRTRAPADIARQLDMKPAESVVQIKRVLRFEGETEPTVFEEIWLPGATFKGLTMERLAGYKGPFYAMFESEFNTRMIRASEHVRAVAADKEVAAILAIREGSPLLSVERLSYTYGDRPVEVRRGWYQTDRFHYQNDLS